jgi:hypothetical protein
MSTVKAAAFNHPSAPSGGLVIDADGLVTGAGMDLVTTQAFNAAASVSINGCFSSDYDNYRILVDFTAGVGANASITARMRVSGTDSSASYRSQWHQFYGAGGQSGGEDKTGTDDWYVGSLDATYPTRAAFGIDLHSPAIARATNFYGQYHYTASDGGKYPGVIFGDHNVATAYDGVTLATTGTSMTGTLRIYGLRN